MGNFDEACKRSGQNFKANKISDSIQRGGKSSVCEISVERK